MKKITLAILSTFILTAGYSQFTKGTILVGGNTSFNLGFNTNKAKFNGATNTYSKSTSFLINPQAGFFLMDNLALGAGIQFATETEKFDGSNDKDTFTSISLTPFGRYYISKFYAQLGFQLGSQKFKDTNGTVTTEDKSSISGWSLSAGYPIFLNESVSLEPQIGYASTTFKDDNDVKDIRGGIFIRLGIYGYLGSLGKK